MAEKQSVVAISHKLARSLGNIILAHSWLEAYLATITLQQHLIQAFHPALPSTLQLPEVTLPIAQQAQPKTIDALVGLSDKGRKEALLDMSDQQRSSAIEVAENWPKLELVDAHFKGAPPLQCA